MAGEGDSGDLVFDPALFGRAEQVLAGRPEQPAKTIVDGLTFEPAAFGTVPGATAAHARTAGWVEQTRTEMGRVGAEVADLEVCTREVKGMAIQVNGDTQAAARLAGPG
jgi:hypothetical protein